jgi:hypothetical protein
MFPTSTCRPAVVVAKTRAAVAAAAAPAMIVAIALSVGLYGVRETGPLWPDAPRYANSGAMLNDWMASGELLNPYRFAAANYAQYPAFSVPYHPPGFPAMLALAFAATGPSYIAARAFVAACLGGAACGFYVVQRRLGVDRSTALAGSVMMMTTPEIARWARDTMSEIPSLCFIMAATGLFLGWLSTGRSRTLGATFTVASVALMSRLTTVGILPGWLLFALWAGHRRRLKSPGLIAAVALCAGLVLGYARFAARYGRYEVVADGRGEGPSWSNLSYFSDCLPEIGGWGTTIVALVAVVRVSGPGQGLPVARFWLSWLMGYTAFKLAMPTTPETRHYLGAMPALAGLTACLCGVGDSRPSTRRLGQVVLALGLALNLLHLTYLPRGLVGYEAVGSSLARQDRPGNVLLACPEDQELIFRFRARAPGSRRTFIRGDRTLAIRAPIYANVAPKILAHRPEDVLDVIRRGRARYLVTSEPLGPATALWTEEMALAHRTAVSMPEAFALVGEASLLVQYRRPGDRYRVCVWAYRGELPDGPSELPVLIPTAGFALEPRG